MLKKIKFNKITKQQQDLIEKDLKIYTFIQKNGTNINDEFKTKFCTFYKIYGAGFKKHQINIYFDLFKDVKKYAFGEILAILYEKLGKWHVSFASKMLHTINPNQPIYDKNIKQYLHDVYGVSFKTYDPSDGKKALYGIYNWHQVLNGYQDINYHNDRLDMIRGFDNRYPSYQYISNIKKIDFIIGAGAKSSK